MSPTPQPALPLAITAGEPAGIGPDLVVMGAQAARDAGWVVLGDADVLRQRAAALRCPLVIDEALHAPAMAAGRLTVMHVPVARKVVPGTLDRANAPHVLRMLEIAADGCQQGQFRALVTGPVQKSIINDAGVRFSGHTEFFCERAGVPDVLMLLVGGGLRVGLATTHLPLRAVADAITADLLTRRLGLLLKGLRDRFGVASPRVLVAGLNPHAGEGGHLGREEIEIIDPVCATLRAAGERVIGPLPADTLFTRDQLAGADAVFAMYHDQGLPVLKHAGFGAAVNVTLGLPYVRTSVDHGTALDRAGTGRVHAGSFSAALALAAELH